MKFPLVQLYSMNRTKPIVELSGIPDPVQWDYCDMEGLPPRRTGITMTDNGKVSIVPYEELPKTFYATNGGEYFIEHIHTLMGRKPTKLKELKINTYGDDDWATPD